MYVDDGVGENDGEDHGDVHDDSVTSDDDESDDAFEPVRRKGTLSKRGTMDLGPPITTDDRMKNLPEVHCVFIQQFVDEAKRVEEAIRNSNGNRKAYFTESNFREMAIGWTMTLEDMRELPGINPENVNKFGKKFIRLVEKYHLGYEEAMSANEDRDIDKNHQNVIDLCSDEDDFSEDGADDDHMSQTEQPSKYFVPKPNVQNWNEKMAQAGQLPQRSHPKSDPPIKSFRGGFGGKGKGKGGKRGGSGRKSTGSSSGAGGSRSRGGQSGITKRKSSGGSSKASRGAQIMNAFGKQGCPSSRGGGGLGGGIGMMPA